VSARFAIELVDGGGRLRALEPTPSEVAAAAPHLAAFYNNPHNRAMLSHAQDLSPAEVADHYRTLAVAGARSFLLELDGRLVGDADLRHIARGHAEFAILVGDRAVQGRGLGTRFATMVHAFAFRTLGLRRLYASIIPANTASLRLFAKLGYERNDTPRARRHADEPDDVTLSLSSDGFEGVVASQVLISRRRASPRP
jgi:RimJ/RimL family protein N-acetyltransferase